MVSVVTYLREEPRKQFGPVLLALPTDDEGIEGQEIILPEHPLIACTQVGACQDLGLNL